MVPGSGVTIATSRRASRLTKLDFAGIRWSDHGDVRPARSRSPRCPSTKCAAISADSRATSGRITSSRSSARPPRAQNRSPARSGPAPAASPASLHRAGPARVELAQRLAGLRPRLGIDEIGQTFNGGQIQPPVEECPARELARLSRPQTGRPDSAWSSAAVTARPPCTCSSSTSSGEARCAGNQNQSFVDRISGLRIAHAAQAQPGAGGGRPVRRQRHSRRRTECAREQVRPALVPSRAQRWSLIRRTSSLPA